MRATAEAENAAWPPVTVEQAVAWFGPPKRGKVRATAMELKREKVTTLVRTINAFRQQSRQPIDAVGLAKHTVAKSKLQKIQVAVRDLQEGLPWLLTEFQREESQASGVAQLGGLMAALQKAVRHIGEPPARGRHRETWHIWADALLPLIEETLKAHGWKQLSKRTPDGPIVRAMCRALKAIDGRSNSPQAIVSYLRRRRQAEGRLKRN